METKRKRGGRGGRPKGTPKTGGRQKGVPNKVTAEAKAACAEIVDDPGYRANLVKRAQQGKLAPGIEQMLWYYAKGKPREELAVTMDDVSALSDDDLRRRAKAIALRIQGNADDGDR